MHYHCTPQTDLDDLVGHEESSGYCYGPLSMAMLSGEELVLEDSDALSRLLVLKLRSLLGGLFIAETGERIEPPSQFRMRLA